MRPPPHPADLHPERDYNEWHAHQFSACTQEETLGLLRHNEAAILRLIESLQEEDLERTDPASSGRNPVSLQQIIEQMLITHAQDHLRSLRATLEAG